jgi:hypothetical protein
VGSESLESMREMEKRHSGRLVEPLLPPFFLLNKPRLIGHLSNHFSGVQTSRRDVEISTAGHPQPSFTSGKLLPNSRLPHSLLFISL